MSLERESMLKLSKDDNAYLFMAKNYINHLDSEYFSDVVCDIDDITEIFEERCLEAHHQIVADMLRYINKNIFKGNVEDTLLWMETELNKYTWEAFDSMSF